MPNWFAIAMARTATGSWNGSVMSAFSVKRRILSLWLPRLPTDRIRRERIRSDALADTKAFPGKMGAGSLEESPSKKDLPCIVVVRQNNALQIAALDDAAA